MSEITITGLQHIGLPTNDMKATVAFYEKLGPAELIGKGGGLWSRYTSSRIGSVTD